MCEFFTYMYYEDEATRILLYLKLSLKPHKNTVVNYPRYPG